MDNCSCTTPGLRGNYSHRWVGRSALLMFVIAYGDIIYFPHYFLKYGIGYLGPYLIICLLLGVPLFALEIFISQFQNLGPIKAFYNLAPILKGVGLSMVMKTTLTSIFFNVYVSASLVLLCRSILFTLGYIHDKEDVASPLIEFIYAKNPNMMVHSMDLGIGYFVSWFFVVMFILKEFQRSGKLIVFYNVIPCFLLFVVLCLKFFGSTQETIEVESNLGERLLERQPLVANLNFWIEACKHVLYDLGFGSGTLSTLASYNRITANCIVDSFFIPLFGLLFGFGCLIIVYDHYEVYEVRQPLLLVLSSYVNIFSKTAASMIYLMAFIKGHGSQMAKIEMLLTAIFDQFPTLREKYYMRVVLLFGFMLMLPGLFLCLIPAVFSHIVSTTHTLNVMLALVLACAGPFASLQYVYIKEKIQLKTWKVVDWYIRICWSFITPLVLLCLIGSIAVEKEFEITSAVMLILLLILLVFITAKEIYSLKFEKLLRPTDDFCTESERSSYYGRGNLDLMLTHGCSNIFAALNNIFDFEDDETSQSTMSDVEQNSSNQVLELSTAARF